MPKDDDSRPQYCCHGMKRDHVVSGGGSMCGGPFRWKITKSEADSLSAYYKEYENFYKRSTNA